jgi:HEAT repeat protein
LGQIGAEAKAAIPDLIKALKDDDHSVRRAVALALRKIEFAS